MADRPNLKRPPMPRKFPPSKSARTFSLEAYIAGEDYGSPRTMNPHLFDDEYDDDDDDDERGGFVPSYDTIDSLPPGPGPKQQDTSSPLATAAGTTVDHSFSSEDLCPDLDPGNNPELPPTTGMQYSSSTMYNDPESPPGFLFP